MERGLSEKYQDRTSPIKRHVDHLVQLGADPGLVNPNINAVTSDVIKVGINELNESTNKTNKQ